MNKKERNHRTKLSDYLERPKARGGSRWYFDGRTFGGRYMACVPEGKKRATTEWDQAYEIAKAEVARLQKVDVQGSTYGGVTSVKEYGERILKKRHRQVRSIKGFPTSRRKIQRAGQRVAHIVLRIAAATVTTTTPFAGLKAVASAAPVATRSTRVPLENRPAARLNAICTAESVRGMGVVRGSRLR